MKISSCYKLQSGKSTSILWQWNVMPIIIIIIIIIIMLLPELIPR